MSKPFWGTVLMSQFRTELREVDYQDMLLLLHPYILYTAAWSTWKEEAGVRTEV
jgi:hypothetical protein